MAIPTSPLPEPRTRAPHRIMIVDDAVVVRGLFSRWLGERAGCEVVASAANGRIALDMLAQARPDLVVLDLDMPEMDGLQALPLILKQAPGTAVLIASTLTRRNAELALRCIAMGATDCISKPETNRELTISSDFRVELLNKIEGLCEARRRKLGVDQRQPDDPAEPIRIRKTDTPADIPRILAARQAAAQRVHSSELPAPLVPVRALLIGSSTGGPRAVADVLASAGEALASVPTIVVQHMPPIFTAVFAEHIQARCGLRAREPFDGEQFQPGVVYVAPGGRHLRVRRTPGGAIVAHIADDPPVNFCRPSVDVTFTDASRLYGASALGLILTGMGHDGLEGCRALSAAGALIAVQDEASSAVWGMPGSVARAGLAKAVMPLDRIAPAVVAALNAHRDREGG